MDNPIKKEFIKEFYKDYITNYARLDRTEFSEVSGEHLGIIDEIFKVTPSYFGISVFWNALSKEVVLEHLNSIKNDLGVSKENLFKELDRSLEKDREEYSYIYIKFNNKPSPKNLDQREVRGWFLDWCGIEEI